MTGATGQLGQALQLASAAIGDVVALDRSACDLAQPASVRQAIRNLRPSIIFNAAAYTSVDRAEREADLADAVNAHAVAVLAEESARMDALLVHYSTDHVFDGEKEGAYVEADPTSPRNAYGLSKRRGEIALAASQANWLCLRTGWVISTSGGNFLHTVMRLARGHNQLEFVDDRTGAPTAASTIAHCSVLAAQNCLLGDLQPGLYHLTSGEAATPYGAACFILERAAALGFTGLRPPQEISRIKAAQYKALAQRPRNSLLDTTALSRALDVTLPHWKEAVTATLEQLCDPGRFPDPAHQYGTRASATGPATKHPR